MRFSPSPIPRERQRFHIVFDRSDSLRMTCQNAGCESERHGWAMVLDVQGSAQHRQAAAFIENDSGRKYVTFTAEDAFDWFDRHGTEYGMTLTPRLHDMLAATPRGFMVYLFAPGQPCFQAHADREVIFGHQQGSTSRVHTRPEDFNEHHNEQADRVNRLLQKG